MTELAQLRADIDRLVDRYADLRTTGPTTADRFTRRALSGLRDASYAANRAVDETALQQTRLDQAGAEARAERRREHDIDARLEQLADRKGGWQ